MDTLQVVRGYFFDVDLASGRFSRVDEYFGALERSVSKQVREIAEKKSEESRAEIARLTEAGKLDDRERGVWADRTRKQLAGWDGIGESARDVMARIEALEGSGAPVAG